MNGLIDIMQLSVGEIDGLIETSNDIMQNPKKYAEVLRGKKLATLFF
jgi:aspartate carbamoyltransferase catalytic subunit